MIDDMIKYLLNQQSMRFDHPLYTEDQIRDIVGAPARDEEAYCVCGKSLDEYDPDCYVHMSQGY